MESLSEGDRAVLNTIFDPLQPLGPSDFAGLPVFQETGDLKSRLSFNLNDDVVETLVALVGHDSNRRLLRLLAKNPRTLKAQITNAFEEDHLEQDVLDIVKKAIVCAEAKNFDESFRFFDEALKQAPKSPSILNDRAQALRLANRNEEALKDLHLAVELSEGKGRAGVQALCQRGALYRWMEQDDKAREDFTSAAKAGSSFAKSQLVALNPYAAMCNAMLHKMTFRTNHP